MSGIGTVCPGCTASCMTIFGRIDDCLLDA